MRTSLFLLVSILVIGCKKETADSASGAEWYSTWIESDLADGAAFHSEFPLKAGVVEWVEFESNKQITVGLVVKDGYDISKSADSICMGTEEQPRMISGSPGIGHSFDPRNGVVRLRLENTSKIDTRIALYSK
jgi:hypothetical protein